MENKTTNRITAGLEVRISRRINRAIRENLMGIGPEVYGINYNLARFRIVESKVRDGIVFGKCLSSGDWHPLGGYFLLGQ